MYLYLQSSPFAIPVLRNSGQTTPLKAASIALPVRARLCRSACSMSLYLPKTCAQVHPLTACTIRTSLFPFSAPASCDSARRALLENHRFRELSTTAQSCCWRHLLSSAGCNKLHRCRLVVIPFIFYPLYPTKRSCAFVGLGEPTGCSLELIVEGLRPSAASCAQNLHHTITPSVALSVHSPSTVSETLKID